MVAFTPAHFRSQKKEFPGPLSLFALFYTEAGVFLAHAGDFLIPNLWGFSQIRVFRNQDYSFSDPRLRFFWSKERVVLNRGWSFSDLRLEFSLSSVLRLKFSLSQTEVFLVPDWRFPTPSWFFSYPKPVFFFPRLEFFWTNFVVLWTPGSNFSGLKKDFFWTEAGVFLT